MRINRLILQAFGHFSDAEFDFGAKREGKSDFHILYGANEAGKTTLMEGWLRLLFGIPLKEKQKEGERKKLYAFRHERRNLKIGAEIEHGGETYALTRIPQGHGSALLGTDGQNAESVLHGLLGDLRSEDKYRNFLCLDDAVIETGGKEIMESKGEMGNLLFSAAAGLTDFSQILEEEKRTRDEIYKKGVQKHALAKLKNSIAELDNKIKAADIDAPKYRELRAASDSAGAAERELAEKRSSLTKQKSLAESILEKHRRRAALQQEFAENIAELAENLARFGLPQELLQAENAELLYQNLAKFILTQQQIDALRAARTDITALAEKRLELSQNLEAAKADCKTSAEALAQLRAALPPQAMAQKLAEALEQFDAAELKQNYRAAQERQETARQRAQSALAALATPQGGRFDALPAAPLSARDAEKLAQIMRDAEAEKNRAEQQERALQAQLAQIKAQFAAPQTARS